MAHYLVTGVAGFIASKVAELLLARGDRVVGVDNLNDAYDVRLKQWRLHQLEGEPGFSFVHADISDEAAVQRILSDARFDAIINLAARAGVRQSVEHPHLYIDTNVTGSLNLLRGCVAYKIPKFVLASTSSLYGGDNPRPYRETLNTDGPLSPYAASKKAAEAFAYTYHYLFGIDVTVLRYFTVYGPAGRPDMSPLRFVQWISEERPLLLFGDGSQERDFTYVDDIARGTIAGLKPLGYEIINLGYDQPVSMRELIRLIEQIVGKTARIEYQPRHAADMMATWADISKAESLLGWRPQISLEQGVRNLVDWYRTNRDWTSTIVTE